MHPTVGRYYADLIPPIAVFEFFPKTISLLEVERIEIPIRRREIDDAGFDDDDFGDDEL